MNQAMLLASRTRGDWHSDGVDVISKAVDAGLTGTERNAPRSDLAGSREARDLLVQARRDGGFLASLPRALELVGNHPHSLAIQINAARILLEGGDKHQALAAWRSISFRFPDSVEAFRLYVRLVRQNTGYDAALALVDERFPGLTAPHNPDELLVFAMALEELELVEQAASAYENVTIIAPDRAIAWRRLAHLQERSGQLRQAEKTLVAGYSACGDRSLNKLVSALRRNIQTLESFSEGGDFDGSPMSIAAVRFIVDEIMPDRAALDLSPREHVGSTMFVVGSLGSGGAERQLVTTALGLQHAIDHGTSVGDAEICGPIAVACRTLNARLGNDFYQPMLEKAGVPVSSYMATEPFGGRVRASVARKYSAAVEFLPPRMREGMVHLADLLCDVAPSAVNIWQDGMILAAGLAALVARVPLIILSVRSMPPTHRVNRWKLEMEPVFRALLSAPGVVLTANSTQAARAYEAWLGLPHASVPLIANGVEPLAHVPGEGDEAVWGKFTQQHLARGNSFTLGTVMRIDDNKRPFDWLEIAATLHGTHPGTRFLIVGDGPLADEAREYAARLGLADRVLFTGRSRSVGFWLAKMDALLLTSRFEGTPNVLIEAQMAGVPVVTTPAGGAADVVQEGVTGFALQSLETIDVDEAVSALMQIVRQSPEQRAAMRAAAMEWSTQRYSVEKMLQTTVDVLRMDARKPLLGAKISPTAPGRAASA
jgi:glycosyltransferase involved in cell wall biosynthesis